MPTKLANEVTDVSDCIFCDIVDDKVPASVVYADELANATMTIGPVNPGYVLVLPKRHAASLADLDEETGTHLWQIATRVAAALRQSGVRCDGINLFLADGEAAFQEVPHVHLHVFPRFTGDAFHLDADWSVTPSRAELDELATCIRRAYEHT